MSETTAAPQARPAQLPIWLTIWTVVLVAGFALVLLLGRPLPSAAEELEAAMHPTPPVSEQAALQSAETIVRLQYPDFVNQERSVERSSDFGRDRWVIVYSHATELTGVRISIMVDTGQVTVATFP
jgi:hypothetical protein